jgi:hypothetical protein
MVMPGMIAQRQPAGESTCALLDGRGMVMHVARCGAQLYGARLTSNYHNPHDGMIWHVPKFCGSSHWCDAPARDTCAGTVVVISIFRRGVTVTSSSAFASACQTTLPAAARSG